MDLMSRWNTLDTGQLPYVLGPFSGLGLGSDPQDLEAQSAWEHRFGLPVYFPFVVKTKLLISAEMRCRDIICKVSWKAGGRSADTDMGNMLPGCLRGPAHTK